MKSITTLGVLAVLAACGSANPLAVRTPEEAAVAAINKIIAPDTAVFKSVEWCPDKVGSKSAGSIEVERRSALRGQATANYLVEFDGKKPIDILLAGDDDSHFDDVPAFSRIDKTYCRLGWAFMYAPESKLRGNGMSLDEVAASLEQAYEDGNGT